MRRFKLDHRLRVVMPFALGIVLLAGCQRTQAPAAQATGPRPTPAPAFPLPIDSTSHAALLAYAHTLTFDTTAPGVDRRYIVVGQGQHLTVGPFVELAPEIGAAAIGHADLVRGRILARITVEASRSFGPVTGVAYLWVDSSAGGLRAVVVPESPTARLMSTPVSVGSYGPTPASCPNLAVARIAMERGAVDPPGEKVEMARLATAAKIVCWPCDCGYCCSDTSFSGSGTLGAASATAVPLQAVRAPNAKPDVAKAH